MTSIIVHYQEIALKGHNRPYFISKLVRNLRKQMADKHAKELDALTAKIAARDAFIRREKAENAALSILAPLTHSPTLMLPHVLKHLDVVEDGGGWRAVVVDPQTHAPRIGDGQGGLMTIEALVAEMASKPEYAPGFKGTGQTGSGAPAGSAGAASGGRIAATDTAGFLANIDNIIAGKVAVTPA